MPGFLNLYRLWHRCTGKAFSLLSRGGFRRFGSRSVLLLPIRVRGEQFIEIGRDVCVGPGSWLEAMGSSATAKDGIISIGDGTRIAGSCTITAAQSVVIEPRVLMAQHVYISDHTHAHSSREKPIKDQGIARISPVRISEGAWLGQGVVICPGVTIGRNAIVGANSVVRRDVPDFCVAVGAPAKIIRKIDEPLAGKSRELLMAER